MAAPAPDWTVVSYLPGLGTPGSAPRRPPRKTRPTNQNQRCRRPSECPAFLESCRKRRRTHNPDRSHILRRTPSAGRAPRRRGRLQTAAPARPLGRRTRPDQLGRALGGNTRTRLNWSLPWLEAITSLHVSLRHLRGWRPLRPPGAERSVTLYAQAGMGRVEPSSGYLWGSFRMGVGLAARRRRVGPSNSTPRLAMCKRDRGFFATSSRRGRFLRATLVQREAALGPANSPARTALPPWLCRITPSGDSFSALRSALRRWLRHVRRALTADHVGRVMRC